MDQTSHPLEQIRSSEVQESLPGVDNGPTQPETNKKVMEAQIRASLEGIYAAIQAGQSTEHLAEQPSAGTPTSPIVDKLAEVIELDSKQVKRIQEAQARVAATYEAYRHDQAA